VQKPILQTRLSALASEKCLISQWEVQLVPTVLCNVAFSTPPSRLLLLRLVSNPRLAVPGPNSVILSRSAKILIFFPLVSCSLNCKNVSNILFHAFAAYSGTGAQACLDEAAPSHFATSPHNYIVGQLRLNLQICPPKAISSSPVLSFSTPILIALLLIFAASN